MLKEKIFNLKRLLLLIVFIGVTLSLLFFLYSDYKQSTNKQIVDVLNVQEKESFSLPVRLRIPAIHVDANIEHVGIASDGTMDVPKNPDDVAWYNLGKIPGEKGNAVIDGHSGWKNGIPASFDYLFKLKKGDQIYVEDSKGIITTFLVRESREYNPEADATSVFSSEDGIAHLNLITCTGTWNKASKSFSKRLVVFADKNN